MSETAKKVKIMIVEDEQRIARFIQMQLEHEGFLTEMEPNGRRAYERIAQGHYDLVLLDVMLPEMNGFEICTAVRKLSDIPIIMLTARDDLDDKVNGLDCGANDYLTKPFEPKELLARIRATLRNYHPANDGDGHGGPRLVCRELVMYTDSYEVTLKGEKIELTKKEYLLLEYLLRNKRTVLSRNQILQEVWGYDYIGDTNVVDVYIRYLRSKIDDVAEDKYIHTMRGIGYVIRD
ncbi:MAG: response regulator transcription factor [Selenomonadaceae bacterium]|nr:response regulator transcription factor [Selenomonadaceae bacterium]